MKTDRFNEAIRRKLEGIEPPFQEQEWKKFQTFTKQQMPASWWVRSGAKWIGYGASGLVATLLIVTNLIQYQENKKLTQTVAELRKEVQQTKEMQRSESAAVQTPAYDASVPAVKTPANPAVSDYSENEVEPNSTKKANKATITHSQTRPASGSQEKETISLDPTSFEENQQREAVATDVRTTESIRTASDKIIRPNHQTEGARADVTSSGIDRPSLVRTPNSSGKTKRTSIRQTFPGEYGNELTGIEKKGSRESFETIAENRQGLVEAARLRPRLTFDVTLPALHSPVVTRKNYKWTNYVPTTEKTEKVAKAPKLRLPQETTVALRAGAGVDLERNFLGKSLAAGVIVGKHWGLSLGLSWGTVEGPRYRDEVEWDHKKNQPPRNFRKEHKIILPPQLFKIKNIQTQASVVRMPIELNYRVPLKQDWTLLAMAGSTLDLKVTQQLQFDVVKNEFPFAKSQIDFKPKEPVLNNLNVGVGIEKRWNHLVVQTEAYLAPSLENCSYRKEQTPAGLRIRALYQFGP
ncbi:hypothetical protein [Siphonobacter sp.]|uniref:hypothetical protein n=1 Tax=Siphonobacter sp. TaxID=1869184 RepID=UPI003B3ADC3D